MAEMTIFLQSCWLDTYCNSLTKDLKLIDNKSINSKLLLFVLNRVLEAEPEQAIFAGAGPGAGAHI